MALAIATNNAALRAAAAASGVNRDMETSMARLSSGKRINSASDDAAGVAIASRLIAEIRGTNQAVRNALDGQALLDTAEVAHKEIENILQRMREVSVQAANDTNNAQDRANLQAEFDAMTSEINCIAGTTTWAGTGLLNGDGTGGLGTATDFSFQVGANTSEADRISVQIGSMSTEALGFGSTAAVAAMPQIGGDAQAVTIAGGTNSTASGSVFSLDTQTVTSGGDTQAVSIAAGNQTTALGTVISIDTTRYKGFEIRGVSDNDYSGNSVGGAGDVNGDGLADLIVGGGYSGASHVVFGKANGTVVDLSTIEPGSSSDGFVINAVLSGDKSGHSVDGAGDVNGDGLADLIVGAWNASSGTGESYVIFGKTDGTVVELSEIELNANTGGFVINGISEGDLSGYSVSGAGDVNGDGLADLIIGSRDDDPNGDKSGASHIVFGKIDGTAIELSAIESSTNSGGFVINGVSAGDQSGLSVSGAGDVNGDGLADLIVSAHYSDTNGDNSGASYVVFGKADGSAVELSAIKNSSDSNGFAINGVSEGDLSGFSVSGAGDVNGDGLADLIIGSRDDDPNGSNSGASHVVFGKADGVSVELSAIELNDNNDGFVIHGVSAEDRSGRSVSSAGDVNGDGLADLIVGASADDPNNLNSGTSHVVFGKADGAAVALSSIEIGSNTNGFVINGIGYNDYSGNSVSGAGDVNGDGLDDVIVGSFHAANFIGNRPGGSHVIFGKADGSAVELTAVEAGTSYQAGLANNATVVVNGKTLTVDLSAHHDGANNDYYAAAGTIAIAINNDNELSALGYSAIAATNAQVTAGTHGAGDVIITRADTPTTSTPALVGTSVSVVIEGVTVTTDVTNYSSDLSGAAAAVASDINADAALQALDYSATADANNPGDIIISRANTPITQAYVTAVPSTTAMSLASGDSTRAATAKIETAIKTVNIQRSKLGAVSNRLSHTVNNLTNISSNLSAAQGSIEDADFAKETTDLAKNQILQQASTAMLAQANASKQNVLSLLQG